MDEIILILLIVAAAVLVMPICALVSASRARREARELRAEVDRLSDLGATQLERLNRLSNRVSGLEDEKPASAPKPTPKVEEPVIVPPPALKPEPAPEPVFVPPPAYLEPAPKVQPSLPELPKPEPKREIVPPAAKPPPPLPKVPEISLEMFMGAKLFAWVGGLALFLGVVFFVKHSPRCAWRWDSSPPSDSSWAVSSCIADRATSRWRRRSSPPASSCSTA
jgi:uncharacterized membrane protein